MLFKESADLEDTTANLERAEKLMQIFFEHTSEESFIPSDATLEDAKQIAFTFTTRFSMFDALIVAVFDIIRSEKEKVQKISDELLKMNGKGKAV